SAREHSQIYGKAWKGSGRHWSHEYSVRHSRRQGLRPGSESTCVSDCAIRQQGHRCAVSENRRKTDDRKKTKRLPPEERTQSERLLCEVTGFSLRSISRSGHDSRPGDEVHR